MRTQGAYLLLFTAALAAWHAGPPARAQDWPAWRGPAGTGVSTEVDLPTQWSEEQNLRWKSALPGWGSSTPAIVEGAIYVTTQQDDALLLLRVHPADGRIVWQRHVGSGTARRQAKRGRQKFHRLHNLASPSPVTDGEFVVTHFGNGDLAVLRVDGTQLWHRNLQEEHGEYSIWWGHANSPVLTENLVIVTSMQDSLSDLSVDLSQSYVAAYDVRTGRLVWKTLRMTRATAEECDSYTTPLLTRRRGRDELVIMGANQLDAYDPATGRQLWALPGLIGGRTITGPTVEGDTIFATRGMRGALVAVRNESDGQRDESSIVWEHTTGTPDSCCPVVYQGLLFIVSDQGIAQCLDAASGEKIWQERLEGDYKASPVAAGGRIYFLNMSGLATVVAADRTFRVIAENQLDDETAASPAISRGCLYLRGRNSLYCIAGR